MYVRYLSKVLVEGTGRAWSVSVPQSGDQLQGAACLWCWVWVFINHVPWFKCSTQCQACPPMGAGPDFWEEAPRDILMHPLPRCVPLRVFCSLLQALYDHLMDFLADRGVDNTFADELIELSTALEHQEYIKFLEDLKSFVKCQ